MARLLRVTGIIVAILTLGLLCVGAAFRFLDADHSNFLLLSGASLLFAANFALLRRGMTWAGMASHAHEAPANGVPISLQTSH